MVKLNLFNSALLGLCIYFLGGVNAMTQAKEDNQNKYVLVIHGGAGVIEPENLTDEKEQALHAALKEALLAGQKVLAEGGEALEAVEQAVIVMEDSPLFNAGKGSVFNSKGVVETQRAH